MRVVGCGVSAYIYMFLSRTPKRERIVCVAGFFSYPAAWVATHCLQMIHLHFWRVIGTVMLGACHG